MTDPEYPETDPNLEPRPEQENKGQPTSDDEPQGLDYVFKIAPADPKNSLDFEDVADK